MKRGLAAGAIAAAAALLLASACGRDTWNGFVYPDKSRLTERRSIGSFDTLEACRDSALRALRSFSSVGAGDYECGRNCRAAPRPEEDSDVDPDRAREEPDVEICETMQR